MPSIKVKEGIVVELQWITASTLNYILIAVLLVIVLTYIFKVYVLKGRKNSSSNGDIEQVKMRIYKQKELVDSVISVNDQEGHRIAEDLHDEVGPILTALKQYLHMASSKLKKGEVEFAEELLNESRDILKEAIQNVRTVSYNLSPTYLEKHGFFSAIQEYINKINKVSEVTLVYTYPENVNPGEEIGINLYKIVLELINNSLKHSEASLIEVNFELDENILTLKYRDNGKGFNEEEIFRSISLKSGLGLNNIQSRVNYINGTCVNKSRKGKGVDYTIKTILIPNEKND